MGQLSPSSPSSPSSNFPASPAPTATEIVTRPDGLARGKWEAPPWVFWTILAIVIVGATVYTLRRLGLLSLKKKPTSSDVSPPSSRMRRP